MKKCIFLLFSFFQIFCLASVTVNAQTITPAPTFSPDPNGYWPSPQTVTITAPGSTIYYTTNGTEPTTALTAYPSPAQLSLSVGMGLTVKAIAVKSGMSVSAISAATFRVLNPPSAPTNAQMRLTANCTWEATWSGTGMSAIVTDNQGVPTTVGAPSSSTTMTCPTGNPEGRKPISVKACTYNVCSAPTAFTVIYSAVAVPTISHAATGSYSSSQSVSITAVSGATIHYTTNNTTPTTSSPVYSTPIPVSTNTIVRAIAVKFGMTNSQEASANLSFPSPAPTFSPDPNGYWPSPQTVTITAPGSTIYYTTDGSTPTTALTGYASPAQVTLTLTVGPKVSAIAVKPGMSPSVISEATFRLVTAPPAPTNAQIRLTQDCVWEATWSPVSGAMHYYVTDTQDESYVSAPFSSTTVACPAGNSNGRKPISVRACHYSACSAPTAFNDITPLGSLPVTIQAESYASMFGVETQATTDVGGGQNVSYLHYGDWMSYTNSIVNIPVTGTYKITYRVASPAVGGVLALKKASDDSLIDTVTIPSTGDFQAWVNVERNVTLRRGQNAFKLYVNARGSGFNINWFKIESIPPTTFPVLTSATLTSPAHAATVSLTAPNPCFQWNTDIFATGYSVYVSNTDDFAAQRWVKTVPVGTTQICWNGGSGWAREGLFSAELPTNLTLATPHFWQVVSTTLNGLGYSEIRSFTPSNSSPASTEFDFSTQSPSNFKYSIDSSGTPNLGTSQNVATTQGDIKVTNGTAQYSVKIDLPPAVRDLAPSLSLSYNSNVGNGIAGVGWNLSGLSAISRCAATVATSGFSAGITYSVDDDLCLDGQRLVPKGYVNNKDVPRSTYWASGTTYVTELANFSEISSQGYRSFGDGSEPETFIVKTKDGKTLYFGEATRNAKVYAVDDATRATKAWYLTRVQDPYSNEYHVYYDYDLVTGEHLPNRITYAPGAAIQFNYTTRLGQIPWGSKDNKKFRNPKVLKSIDTYIDVTNPSFPQSGTPVKRYDVGYKLSTVTERDLIETIRECGWANSQWRCAKPLTFDYESSGFTISSAYRPTYTTGVWVTGIKQLADMDGDGYNDAILAGGSIAWGQANGQFIPGGWVSSNGMKDIAPVRTASGMILIGMSVDETAKTQYMVVIHSINRASQTKEEVRLSFINGSGTPDTDSTDAGSFAFADEDCDGLDDMLYRGQWYTQAEKGNPWSWQINKSYGGGKSAGIYLANWAGSCSGKKAIETKVNYNANETGEVVGSYGIWVDKYRGNEPLVTELMGGAYQHTVNVVNGYFRTLVDLNGDGIKELVANRKIGNTWSLKWVHRVGNDGFAMDNETDLLGSSGPTLNCFTAAYDYDKDGREDFLGDAGGGGLTAFLARDTGGTAVRLGASKPVGVFSELCHPVGDVYGNLSNMFKGDVNNDGRMDFSDGDKFYLVTQKQPDLLLKVKDGFDAEVAVEYSTLTGDTNNGKPLYTPDSAAPVFPQVPADRGRQVVKKLSFSNTQGGYNDRFFNYSGAKMDVQGRGFLGFASIETTDVAAGVTTLADYRQSFPYIGRIDQVTTKSIAGDLINSTKNAYAIHAGNARFPYVDYSLQKNYQLTTTSLTSPLSVTKVKNTYDVCGNLTEQISETGIGVSGAVVTGVLSRVKVANDVNYYSTSDCSDDFVYRTTKEASKTHVNDDLRVTVAEFEPNAAKEVRIITAFKGTPQQKVTVIDRAANGVVTSSSETANDIDNGTTTARTTMSSDLAKGQFPQTITNVLSSGNHVTTVGYDYRFGLESSIRLPNLQTTNRTYDYLGRLTEESQDDGTRSEIISFYCSAAPVSCPTGVGAYYGVATKVTNINSIGKLGAPLSIVYYDNLQREIRRAIYSLDGKAINTDTTYRADGKLAAVSEPFVTNNGSGSASYWTRYSDYDALGRPHKVEGADGGSQFTSYEKYSTSLKVTNTVTVVGPRSNDTQITQRFMNPIGQVEQVIDAIGTPVNYTYTSTGNLATTKVNNNLSTLISIEYDSQGNKNHIVDPDAGVIDFDYNGFGEMRRQIWQKNNTSVIKSMVLSYDQLGRQITRVDNPTVGSPTTYTWVWDTQQKGRLTSESGNNQTITYGYDGFSRVNSAITSIGNLAARTFVYGYDDFGRPNRVTYPNGLKISRQYHAAGMAVQTSDITDSLNPKVLWALGDDLDSRGNFNNQLWGNGVVTQTGFDGKNGQLNTIKSGRLTASGMSGANSDIQALSYEYDTIGNLQTRTSQRTNAAGVALENIREEFSYDKLNRLKTSTTSGLFARYNNYDYNELGNLTSRVSKLGSSNVNDDVGVLSYAPTSVNNAGVHAVTAAGTNTYRYDKYGNMTSRGTDTIEYNVFNKPIRISGTGGTTTIDYDANHDRFRETNDSTVTYTFAGGLYEEVVAGTTTTQKAYVDGVILNTRVLNSGVQASNDTLYLHTDNLGSVEAYSDKLGAFVSRMSFSDWGKRQQSDWKTGSPTDAFPTANGYTGHHQLDQHKLVHMGGRVYDPSIGRFMSADLFVQSPYSSQSFNRYTYVSNNPMSSTDPSGYCTRMAGDTRGGSNWNVFWSTGDDCGGDSAGLDTRGNNTYNNIDYGGTTHQDLAKQAESAQQEQINRNAEACSNGGSAACVEAVDYLKEIDRLPGADMSDTLVDTAKVVAALATAPAGGSVRGWASAIKEFFKKGGKKGTFPDEVFTGKSPHQTTPGTKTVTQERYNPETNKLERSEITYDKYGRQETRIDYTNHGYGDKSKLKEYHSDPHKHKYEYGPGYGPKGKETRINYD